MIFYDIYSLFGPADNINKRKETVNILMNGWLQYCKMTALL